jgi:multicomponent K+:H+ antiporter subunit G
MSANDLPLWAEVLTALLLMGGGLLALVGTLGLWRLHSFYQRIHGPSLVNTLATALVLLASILFFSMTEGRLVWHELIIAVFVALTVPVTTMMLARAALYRHRRAGKNVPGLGDLRGGKAGDIHEKRPTGGDL